MNNKDSNDMYKMIRKIWACIIAITIMTSMNTIMLLTNNGGSNLNKDEEIIGDYDISAFKEVTAKELLNNNKGDAVVYIGRASCLWCVRFAPVLTEVTKEYKLNTLYIDIAKIIDFEAQSIIDEESYNTMLGLKAVSDLEGYMKEEFGSTPMLLVMKDGVITDVNAGYQDVSALSSFLDKNGFKK